MRDEDVLCDGSSKLSFDLNAPLDMHVHLWFEETNARPAIGFCAIKRTICAPDQLVGIYAVISGDSDANSNAKLGRSILDWERVGSACDDTPRQVRRIVDRAYFGHDDPEFVSSNSGQNAIPAQGN
jgi:hypothetical protein